MALKFLNKKGWHTGSLRNIENVWKAEQKHEAEQHKLEELRKQIQEDHEKAQFRLLQEQAGLVPRQERLDFLYESGLAVGKGSSEGFKALQAPPAASASAASTGEGSSSKAAVPGALFDDKPQSANDAWRKLHSDPLLLIRQREQEALARIKNNPIKMAMIKKSLEAEKNSKQEKDKLKKKKHKERHNKSINEKHSKAHSGAEDSSDGEEHKRKRHHLKSKQQDGKRIDYSKSGRRDYDNSSEDDDERKRKREYKRSERREDGKLKYEKHRATTRSDSDDRREERVSRKSNSSKYENYHEEERQNRDHSVSHHHHSSRSRHGEHSPRVHLDSRPTGGNDERKGNNFASDYRQNSEVGGAEKHRENDRQNQQSSYNRRRGVPKMSEEERAAKLKEMQADAEVHEEQRWKRLKKAAENDAQEAMKASFSRGKNFLDDAQKSIYGAEKGGSVTIEESVRRRAFYSQGSSAHESNAFRR